MVYLGSKASFSINMDKIAAGNMVETFWIDPRTGESVAISQFPNTGTKPFSTPDGWEDALLILEASAD
jgi:Putative collagen-binding domain of a collagenase